MFLVLSCHIHFRFDCVILDLRKPQHACPDEDFESKMQGLIQHVSSCLIPRNKSYL